METKPKVNKIKPQNCYVYIFVRICTISDKHIFKFNPTPQEFMKYLLCARHRTSSDREVRMLLWGI